MKRYLIKFTVDNKPRYSHATAPEEALSLFAWAKNLDPNAELYEAHYCQITAEEAEAKAQRRAKAESNSKKPKSNGDNNGNGNNGNNGNGNGNGNSDKKKKKTK